MGQKLQGLLIRKRRQEREWSQAALCNGICAVSYLSKIEQGKVESSPEVLDLLFRRLDIRMTRPFAGRLQPGLRNITTDFSPARICRI